MSNDHLTAALSELKPSNTPIFHEMDYKPTLDTVQRGPDFDDIVCTIGPVATGMHAFCELVNRFGLNPYELQTARVAVRAGVGSETLPQLPDRDGIELYIQGVTKARQHLIGVAV